MQKILYGSALLLGSLISNPWAAAATETGALGAVRADSVLAEFVRSVVASNPRVQAARAALEAGGALRDAASRPLYNPQLSLDAESADTDTRALGISQTLDWGGKRQARTAVAESGRRVAEVEYLAVRWLITIELLSGLAQHQTGVEREALAESRRQLMDQFVALAERRFDAGDLSQVELDLARLVATEARIQQATAGVALAEARQGVGNLTPMTPAARWPSLPVSMPALAPGADVDALLVALPEVLAARRLVESAAARVELRRRERRPDPSLSLAGGEEDGETLVGLSVTIPLYVRNRFSHEVTAALAEHRQAQQGAEDALQRAHARLISAAERYALLRGAWDEWERTGQTSLTRQSGQLQKLWEAGELSTTDYLVQLRHTLDVQESALNLHEALWRAWFEWLSASGQVDAWLGQGGRR